MVLLFVNLAQCFFFVKIRNAYSINSSKLEAKSINHYEEGISEGFLNTLRYEESSFQVSNSAKNQISALFNNTNEVKLFFRIEFPFCDVCVYPTIDKISEYSSLTNNLEVLLISSFPSEEYAADFNKIVSNKKIRVLNIPNLEFCLDNHNPMGAYLFTMNADFQHENLLVINKSNKFMVDRYLDYIKTKYNFP